MTRRAYPARMTRFGIDARTFLHVARQERRPDPAHQLVAPNSLRTRALELLLTDVAEGAVEEREALRVHERLTEIKVRLLGDRVSRRTAWDLAREHGWADLADAEVLAVTRLQADALLTIDEQLAARAEGLVPLAPLDRLWSSGS
jgi:predicted nucleic acid-binding protein